MLVDWTEISTTGLNLLISDKPDVERDSVAEAFARCGGAVHRIGRSWDPPYVDPSSVRVYGADSFCLVLQQKLGFTLCSPNDDLLLRVPPDSLKRTISRQNLGETRSEEHTSELQSRRDLVCRLLLEKKKKKKIETKRKKTNT